MKRPNILVIMPDTWRGDSLGCAGHPAVKTPNLDRLASMGVLFENAYTSGPVCMPARSNCLSGQYCHNTGQWGNFGRFPVELPSYMRELKTQGYRTAHIGKSHYYSHVNTQGDGTFHLDEEKAFLHALGIDDVLETTGPWATVGTDSILSDRLREKGLLEPFRDDYRERQRVGPFRATWPSPLPEAEHMDSFVGRTACEYLNGYDDERPFAVFVGFGGPHDPWDPPQNWADRFADANVPAPLPITPPEPWLTGPALAYHTRMMGDELEEMTWQTIRRLYYAKMAHIDSLIGELLDTLERKGSLNDTMILFWSDHGDRLCDRGKYAKGVFYDEAAKVPIILRLPGETGAGRVCKNIVSINDIFPTLLEAAGVEDVESFGQSLIPVATGQASTALHEAVFSETGSRKHRQTMIRTERHKMVINEHGDALQLFDMQADPKEMQNLAGHRECIGLEQTLKLRILMWRLQTETVQ